MKKKLLFVIVALIFVGLIIGAVLLYNHFYESYSPDDKTENSVEKDLAPDFTVVDNDDNPVSLSDNFGKPIVVNFWATWCGPCISELPSFENLYKEYGKKVTFMMVNMTDGYQEKLNDVKSFITDNKYNFPVYFDTGYSAANAYFVSSIPKTIFINEDGELEDTHLGAMSEETLENYIKDLID